MNKILEKQDFATIEPGARYAIPNWNLGENGIEKTGQVQTIAFIRGVKDNPEHPIQEGILHEGLLNMMIADLTLKNKEVPNRYTSLAITYLENAQWALRERAIERVKNQTVNTSKV